MISVTYELSAIAFNSDRQICYGLVMVKWEQYLAVAIIRRIVGFGT